jgi:putative ABC transport system permease protein
MKYLRSDLLENFKMAISTVLSNKLRSFLTIFGVVIGVWTVMAIASIISGIDSTVKKEIQSFGVRSIFIAKFQPGIHIGRLSREERMRKPLTYEDAAALSSLPAVELAVPMLEITNDYFGRKIMVKSAGKSSASVQLWGTLPDYEKADIWVFSEGRFFTEFESDTNQEVCVIGSTVVENFFPYGSPINKTIEIGGHEFRIIGIFEKREQLFASQGSNDDSNNLVILPYGWASRLKPSAEDIFILAVARHGMIDEARDQITDLLRIRRHVPFGQPNNFGMSTADTIIEQFRSITFGVAIAMVAISSVGLMVGGIGVMNIMLVSVTERTREIGVRKAIGARRKDILYQFLIEAMTLTGLGGLIGLLLGWLTTLLIGIFLPSYVPLWAPVAGFLASVGIGVIFGLWPAWKAAKLNPIDSLRYE